MSSFNPYYYALPVVVAVSFAHGAARFDDWKLILKHSVRLCLLVLALLAGVTVFLLFVNSRN